MNDSILISLVRLVNTENKINFFLINKVFVHVLIIVLIIRPITCIQISTLSILKLICLN